MVSASIPRKYSDALREKQPLSLPRPDGDSAVFFVLLRMTQRDFPPDLFFNPSGADRGMKELHEIFIRSGSRFTLPDFSAALLRGLKSSTDPDLALRSFHRFVGASFGTAALFNDILQYPAYGDLLFSLFGHSQYFADVLVREPALFRWLTSTGALTTPVTGPYLRAEIERVLETFRRADKRLDALKRMHRRELLRIGAQDLLGSADLLSATEQLSVLAASVLDAALGISLGQIAEAGEPPPRESFSIIALGKLGGTELNYSSDIDIIFVYSERSGAAAAVTHAYFNRLAGRLVRNLSQASGEGHLYRVDTRLRPNAGAGPLALSEDAFLSHYESRGEIWERQMLLKARPVAGDTAFGGEFLHALEPFVYPRTLTEHPAASIARIKSRIEAGVADEPNIKLMAGGIRDIEFIAQTLQLINGGLTPGVREPNTLRALSALEAHDLLSKKEHETLREAYVLFRTIEHRLQMMLNTQTHTLPRDRRAFEVLARRTGLSGAAELRRALEANLGAVRGVFNQVLGGEPASAAGGLQAVIAAGSGERSLVKALGGIGFHDVRRAAKDVRLLSRGGAPAGMPGNDTRARESLAAVAPVLFEGIAATRDPDLTLSSIALLATAQPLPHLLYDQCADPAFRKFILSICGTSPRFARELGLQPLLLEFISSESEGLALPSEVSLPAHGDAASYKSRHELLAGVRHLLGFTDFDALTSEISAVASSIVTASYDAARGRRKRGVPPLAVFALGKFGTEELAFDADIDLLFVSGEAGQSSMPLLENLAARILAGVTASSSGERLYESDVRLRPEGKSAPLVVDASAYAKYIAARASLWERQSLTRLRFVAGDTAVGGVVAAFVSSWVYESPLPPGWGGSIVAMRRAMESRTRSGRARAVDLKLGPGGMADVEFIVQMVQLKFGGQHPEIRGAKVGNVLRQSWLPSDLPCDRTFLASAYAMYRRLELLMRIGLEDRGRALPGGEKLQRLARLYDGSSGIALGARVSATMARVRKEFLAVAAFVEKETR
jgi:[glutamine synthetase] adenylyltransferase / [glutamine synthetase]-adenylyl-L-tyrosine phosphorylase